MVFGLWVDAGQTFPAPCPCWYSTWFFLFFIFFALAHTAWFTVWPSFSANLINILTNINPGTFPSANPTNQACWICLLKTPPKLPSSCVVLCWGHYRGARHWFKQLCMALTSEVWHTHKSTIQDLKKGTLLTHTAQQMWFLSFWPPLNASLVCLHLQVFLFRKFRKQSKNGRICKQTAFYMQLSSLWFSLLKCILQY